MLRPYIGPRHIREYQAELFQKPKLSANSVGQHLAAVCFFYIKTLRRGWRLAAIIACGWRIPQAA
jgi:Phage integrase, N-terminal SAM-like domain